MGYTTHRALIQCQEQRKAPQRAAPLQMQKRGTGKRKGRTEARPYTEGSDG